MANSALVGALRVLLTLDSADYESGIARVNKASKAWQRDLADIGRQASDAGLALTKALTLPLAGLGIATAKAAIDFESSFAGVRKTINATDAEFAEMAQGFRDLAKTIPVNVNELNRLGEAAGALGIPKAEVVDFARVMALLGVTTNVTSDQAAESIAKIQNIFGAAGKDTDRFASTLVALGNDGASTESQILEMATRIAGAGNAVGMTQGQVLGFASALSSVGIEAEMGGSAISRVFIDIAAAVSQGGESVRGFADVAGTSVEQFAQLFKTDAANAVNQFIGGLGRIKQSGGDLLGTLEQLGFSEIRVRDTLLRTAGAGDLLTKALDLQGKAWTENQALTAEAEKRFETTSAKLTLLWNRVQDVAITIGNAFLPAIKSTIGLLDSLLPAVNQLANAFAALPGPIQMTALGFVGLAAAAGPALYVFGQFAMAGAKVARLFTDTGIATRALGTAFGVLTSPITAIVATVGTLSIAWARMTGDWTRAFDVLFPPLGILRTGWDGLRKAMEPHLELLRDLAAIVEGAAVVAWAALKDVLSIIASVVLPPLVKAWDAIKGAISSVVVWIRDHAIAAFNELAAAILTIPGIDTLIALFVKLKGTNEGLREGVKQLAADMRDAADAVNGVAGPSVKAAKSLVDLNALAIKPLGDGLELLNQQVSKTPQAVAAFTGELARARDQVAALSAETRKSIESGLALGYSVKEVAERLKLSERVVELYKDQLADTRKSTTALATAQEKLADFITKTNLALGSGKEVWRDFRDGMAKVSESADRVGRAIIDNALKQKESALELDRFIRQRTLSRFDFEISEIKRWAENEKLTLDHSVENWRAAAAEIDAISQARIDALIADNKELQEASRQFPGLPVEFLSTGGIETAGDKSGDTFGKSFKAGFAEIVKGFPQLLANAFVGGGGGLGALKALGTQVGALLNESINAALIKNGMKKGVAGLLSSLPTFGITAAIELGLTSPGKVKKQIGDLLKALDPALGKTTDGSALAQLPALVDQVIERYGSLEKAGINLAELIKLGPVAAFEALKAALDQKDAIDGFAKEQKVLEDQLGETNSKLDDQISKANDLGYVFDREGNLIGFNFQKVEDTAESLGVRLEALGPSFKKAKIAETATEFTNKLTLLFKAGGDVGGILADVAGKFSTLANDAKKTGAILPAQMKPWMEELLRSGKLVDENGQKLESLAGINFGDPVETEFEGIQKAIKDTVQMIRDLIGKIDELIRKQIPDKEYTVREKVVTDDQRTGTTPGEIPVVGPGDDESTVLTPAATGGLFGRPTPLLVGEGGESEIVGPVSFIARALRGAMASMPEFAAAFGASAPALAGGATTINNNEFHLTFEGVLDDGALVNVVQRKVIPIITQAVSDNIGGSRTNLNEALGTT